MNSCSKLNFHARYLKNVTAFILLIFCLVKQIEIGLKFCCSRNVLVKFWCQGCTSFIKGAVKWAAFFILWMNVCKISVICSLEVWHHLPVKPCVGLELLLSEDFKYWLHFLIDLFFDYRICFHLTFTFWVSSCFSFS